MRDSLFADYIRHGWVIAPLQKGSKNPHMRGWSQRELCYDREIEARGLEAAGLAHAYSGTCAIDIDDLEMAREYLNQRGIDIDALAGAPDAVRIASGRPNRLKLLYALPGARPSAKIYTDPDEDGKRHNFIDFRCGTRSGTTAQDALPPTIHPDTGEPYRWEYGDDLVGHWSALPDLPDELDAIWLELIGPEREAPSEAEEASVEELRRLLEGFSPDCGYVEWINVGMALHSATAGSEEGFDLWDEWSQGGDKYRGVRDLEAHWPTFRGDGITVGYLRMNQVADAEEFDVLEGEPEGSTKKEKRKTFEAVKVSDWVQRPPPKWIIDGVLPQADLAMLYGPPGSGKSFLALDIGMSVATSLPWRDREVEGGPVLWLAAEAAGSVRNRALAYAQEHELDLSEVSLWIVGDTPDMGSVDDVRELAAIAEDLKPRLIVVDTLSAASGGANENSGEDMGAVLAGCRVLHRASGALVMLVHHSGKDETKGARGWSGLKGAMQTELELRHEPTGERIARIAKQRDGESDVSFAFRLRPVALDPFDGKEQVSCVVEPVEGVSFVRMALAPGWFALLAEAVAAAPSGSITALRVKIADAALGLDSLEPIEDCVAAALTSAADSGMILTQGDEYDSAPAGFAEVDL